MDFVTERTVRFLEDLKGIDKLDALADFMSKTLTEFQIEYFSLFELGCESKPGDGALAQFPTEWGQRYLEKKYEYNDPVHSKVLRTKAPFLWKTLQAEGYLDGKGRKIFHEGGEFGLKDGCTFPIFGTNGYTAVITYAANRLEDDPRLFPAMHLISLYFHGKYRDLAQNSELPPPDLSPRERECLKWAGKGKTEFEIGEILRISAATVHTHIEHARQKFGVHTTIQAVMEAMRHHLITA
jgi:DNA-binding CsgD family transcriptional regulator